ncbi:MAG: DUF3987 domain-containing protein [Bacteroidaceae bacterium]|nr:DUF3987 domain-containing protein [Bacteroidaceae bacterium]
MKKIKAIPASGANDPLQEARTEEAAVVAETQVMPYEGEMKFGEIPYKKIIERWFHDVVGHNPLEGERNNSLFRLCTQLAYIAEFNRETLLTIVPRLGLSEKEVEGIVDSALKFVAAHRSTAVPYSLWKVLKELEQETQSNTPIGDQFSYEDEDEEWEEEQETDPDLPALLPPGIKEYVDAAPKRLKKAYLMALLPLWGTMLTRLRARYLDNQIHSPSLQCCIIGGPASGKGFVRKLSTDLLSHLIEQDARMEQLEQDWDDAMKQRGGGAKEVPLRPKVPMLYKDGDITTAEILNRLKFNRGLHFIICSDEIDSLTKSRYSTWATLSEFFRKAFDNGRWGQDRAGSNAVRGHADAYCNLLAACTPDRVPFYFGQHVHNGLASRVTFVRLIEKLGEEMPVVADLSKRARARIEELRNQAKAESMNLTETVSEDGSPCVRFDVMPERFLNMKFLNERLEQWLEEQRILCIKENSKARDVFRRRASVIGFRAGMIAFWLWGCKFGRKTMQAVGDFAYWVAEQTMNEQIFLFGEQMSKPIELGNGENSGKYTNIFDEMENVFTIQDVRSALARAGQTTSERHVVYLWKKNRLIEKFQKKYYKVGTKEHEELQEKQAEMNEKDS